MKYRTLGRTGLEVSEVSFGAWQLGNQDDWGKMDDVSAHKLVLEAINRGVNLFDTAPNYANTNSERLLGEAINGKRDKVILVSKFGHRPEGPKDFSVNWFWESLEASLKRLKTDYLDVLLLHNPDADMYSGTDPLWEALAVAKQQGKIRHYGASLDFAAEVESCLTNTKSEVLEILFNIFHQDVRKAFPVIKKNGAGVIVKVPLDSGWLTGSYNAQSKFSGIRERWSLAEVKQRSELVSKISWLSKDGSDLAQRALAFVLAYDEISCVIPGTRSLEHLESSLQATDCKIHIDERRKLESLWENFTSNGTNLLPW